VDGCLKTREVEAFVAGELSAEDRARFEAHLAACSGCRQAVSAGQRDRDLARGIRRAYKKTAVSDSDTTFGYGPGQQPYITDCIEGYEILDEIHRGGQGVVYKAVQLATKRTVALKVLLHGQFASARQQHRFEREIDLVASLQHPNIVTIYDSGLAHGRHYFAMEYVHGRALDAYVANAKPSVDATLRLFQKICSAVNAAHQRGVIHRDLKPGNILVDASGEPHMLDFGLAKAAGADLRDGVPVTMPGEFMGTLAYASPEQISGDAKLVDIRTDVYSLGVILFEMLTGTHPYDVDGSIAEVFKNILEVEPTRPSKICEQIDDEIETIVLQALAKDKERRYQSADALARDVGRYLAGEPLDAKRESTWYVLRKSLRRHRYAAGVAAAFVFILAGSTVALSVMYQNQSRARRDAEAASVAEQEQRALAEGRLREATAAKEVAQLREMEAIAARAETQKRADELEIVTEFQQSMLSEIDAAAMGRALYADLRDRVRVSLQAEGMSPEEIDSAVAEFDQWLRRTNATDAALKLVDEQVLRRAAETIESKFADQAVIRAALQQTVADTYCRIGRYPPAMPLQEAALRTRRVELGNDHPDTLDSINNMGYLLESIARSEEARAYYQEALEGRRRVLGDEHADTLSSINNMGALLADQGKLAEAEPYYREALEVKRRVLGDEHPDTLTSINNMGFLLHRQRKLAEAEPYYRECLEGLRRVLGDEHPHTLSTINNLGALLESEGKYAEAEKYLREGLAGLRRALGDEHPNTLRAINNLGGVLKQQDKLAEAESCLREALAGCRRVLGNEHPTTLSSINNMGAILESQEKLVEAELYFREALEVKRRVLGDDHQSTITAVHNLGGLLRRFGKLQEAETLGAEAVAWARKSLPQGHPNTGVFVLSYGVTLSKFGRYSEAEAMLLEAHAILKSALGANHGNTVKAAQALVDLYDAWHAADPDGGHDAKAGTWRAGSASESAPEP
jgi:serine/threonine protein kinase/Tfp pilus assembly protein PilF